MTDAFGKYSHAIAGLYYFVQSVKGFAVIGRIAVFLAGVHWNGT